MSLEDALEAPTGYLHQVGASRLLFSHEMGRLKVKEVQDDELKEYMETPEARRVLQYYMTEGKWREEWFDRWAEGEFPHAQICTVVWITASLAAMEILKLITGKWKPVAAPYYD